jgi:hypothetical protein
MTGDCVMDASVAEMERTRTTKDTKKTKDVKENQVYEEQKNCAFIC